MKSVISNTQKRILVAGQPNIASTAGGSITIFHHFCHLLVEEGYYIIGTCHSDNSQRPAVLDDRVRFVNTFIYGTSYSTAFNKLVDECHPDLIVFFFPALYMESHLEHRFCHITRLLMFHSRPDVFFASYFSLNIRLRREYINTHAQVLLESYRDRLPGYIRKGPVHIIANGIKQFSHGIDYSIEHKRIVYFSRVDRFKGVDLLIEAMAVVRRFHPDWSVDVYGDVEPVEYKNELLTAIAEKDLDEQVHLMGRSAHSQEETLKAYDFCLFPSRMEGFSIGLGETMSIGLPCIGLCSCTGVNEVILDGINGLLCDDAPEDIARSINILIEQPAERERLGRNARLYMRQYDPAIIDMKWGHLIRSILYQKVIKDADVRTIVGQPTVNVKVIFRILSTIFKKWLKCFR